MLSLQFDQETAELIQKASAITNLSPAMLIKEMVQNLGIHHFLGEDFLAVATQVDALVFEKEELLPALDQLIVDMKRHKVNNGNPVDRYCAITITLLEQAAAVYYRHVDP